MQFVLADMRGRTDWMSEKIKNQDGGLSVAALWMLALLSVITLGVARTVLLGLRSDRYSLRATEAIWLARAGVRYGMAVLQLDAAGDSVETVDAYNEAWANSRALFQQVSLGNGFFEVSYIKAEESLVPQKVYGIIDENRKININRVPADVLLRLPGMSPEKVAALLDWRDADAEIREGGAEEPFYMGLKQPYICRDGDLESLGELELVRGFSREDVRRLANIATVYGDGRVNINTASADVLRFLGMRAGLARKISRARWGRDGTPFTDDDVLFVSESSLVASLRRLIPLRPKDELLLNQLLARGLVGVNSTHFTIRSVGLTMSGKVRRVVQSTVYRANKDRVDILEWVENQGR